MKARSFDDALACSPLSTPTILFACHYLSSLALMLFSLWKSTHFIDPPLSLLLQLPQSRQLRRFYCPILLRRIVYSTNRVEIINPSNRWKIKHSCIYTCNHLYENRGLRLHLCPYRTHELKPNFEFDKTTVVTMMALKHPQNPLSTSIKIG